MHRNSLQVELWLGKDALVCTVYLFNSQYFILWHETNSCPYIAIYSLSWIELLRKKKAIVSVCKCSLDGGGSSFTVLAWWMILLTECTVRISPFMRECMIVKADIWIQALKQMSQRDKKKPVSRLMKMLAKKINKKMKQSGNLWVYPQKHSSNTCVCSCFLQATPNTQMESVL